jgi:glycosyltransferase involved in cell wall biosynthesis
MKSFRIAFLTPEFITEKKTGGGLENYLNRIAQILYGMGHHVEVFVPSDESSGQIVHDGILVNRVSKVSNDIRLRIGYLGCKMFQLPSLREKIKPLHGPLNLARALAAREDKQPFDLVQSSDYLAAGLFVKRSRHRKHIVRCSNPNDLYAIADNDTSPKRQWLLRLARLSIRRADIVYAPSQFTAYYYQRTHSMKVDVLRPPAMIETEPSPGPWKLPDRYFLYFGKLKKRKGTEWLARALPKVWAEEPNFQMVWAGNCTSEAYESWAQQWGENRAKIMWLGAITKPHLYDVLQKAEATVIPSLVDNLPNTAIESLMFGIPVIGSRGASIDELVEPGVNGELTTIDDIDPLAAVLVRAWRKEWPVRKGFQWRGAVAESMRPDLATTNLLRLGGLIS